ncbi:hypothetical protein [Parvularcula lutaonensis]|uniref:Uncharacterized protein n=1 Tax=Parvularcula lutaonensis TaxID=491923 RepID=A0ABV7MDT4_9PROT|nr:hypothetical protein [Parvularcula lutaonensis]GGY50048.1 hypothetical protein GCM10007148_18510 [Parvularcula lutaonensis]
MWKWVVVAAAAWPMTVGAVQSVEPDEVDRFTEATMRLRYGCAAAKIDHVRFDPVDGPMDLGRWLNDSGDVVALKRLVWRLQRSDPEAYEALESEVRAAGFRDARQFARVGDRILMVSAVTKGDQFGLDALVDRAMSYTDAEYARMRRKQRILTLRVKAFGEKMDSVPPASQAVIEERWSELSKIDPF